VFANFNLTLFHNGDTESTLIATGINALGQPTQFGGAARFKTKLDQVRGAVVGNVLTLNSGDTTIPGPFLDASLQLPPGTPFYDAVAYNAMGYDASVVGNHEFDLGPAAFRKFLDGVNASSPFIGTNLNYAAEPQLSPLVGSKLVSSKVVNYGPEKVGIVGAVTETLPFISTIGGVQVNPIVTSIQSEINALQGMGVNKIVLVTQNQALRNDWALAGQLTGVDVIVSGGGEELMANPGTLLVPGDSRPAALQVGPNPTDTVPNQYPLFRTDAGGNNVAIVAGATRFKYVGQLSLTFDNNGVLQPGATGTIHRVVSQSTGGDGVAPDPTLQSSVVDPVQTHINGLVANKIARTEVDLEGRRNGPNGTGIRRTETNLGNLVADALRWQAAKSAAAAGTPLSGPIVGLQNGGGIRNDSLIPKASVPGNNFSELDAYTVVPFANFVTVAEDISAGKLKQILEHSVANVGGGQFGQWSGLRFSYDPKAPVGSRIVDVFLTGLPGEAEQLIIDDGIVLTGAPTIDFATIDFLAEGGDAYPLTDLTFNDFLDTYKGALQGYLTETGTFGGLTALGGLVDASRYAMTPIDDPLAFESSRRIDAVPEPTALTLLAFAGLLAKRRSR
jgi:5'-nucleotidase